MRYGISLEGARSMVTDLGPVGFAWKVRELLGLGRVVNGIYVANRDLESGRPVLESQQIRPDVLNSAMLAQVLLGWSGADELKHSARANAEVNVLEASLDVTPTKFANISAYNSAIAGMIEAKIIEVWNRPEFLADQLFENIPSNKRSEQFAGISNIGDIALERKPGNRHVRAELSERYQTTPVTVNHGVGIDVTREAATFDITRQVLQQAESVTESLRLRKEYRCLDVFLGITNPYNYNGTSYNTYLTSGLYTNKRSLPFVDWTTFDTALQAFIDLTDPETGEPISITPTQAFVMPAKWATFNKFLTDTVVETRTQTQAVVSGGTHPFRGAVQVVNSMTYPYAYRKAIASAGSGGLALAAADAKQYWWLGNFKKAFAYLENLPLHIERPMASDYEMADRGLVFSVFADEMGVPFVMKPWEVQLFTN